MADMTETVPIAQLRQNPAPALKAVSEGKTLVVTSHNRPVADLAPHREAQGVSPSDLIAVLTRTPVDDAWSAEVADARDVESDDPWA